MNLLKKLDQTTSHISQYKSLNRLLLVLLIVPILVSLLIIWIYKTCPWARPTMRTLPPLIFTAMFLLFTCAAGTSGWRIMQGNFHGLWITLTILYLAIAICIGPITKQLWHNRLTVKTDMGPL